MNQYLKPLAYGCENANNFPAIVYSREQVTAVISLPVWNSFSREAKIGALYKEALRFLQSENQVELFNGEGMTERTEMILSKVVSTLVMDMPRSGAHTLQQIFAQAGFRPQLTQVSKNVDAEIEKAVQMQRDALRNNNIQKLDEATAIVEKLLAAKLHKLFQSPEVRAATRKLNAITYSLQSPSAEGPIALEIIRGEIAQSQNSGRPLPQDIQTSIQRFHETLETLIQK